MESISLLLMLVVCLRRRQVGQLSAASTHSLHTLEAVSTSALRLNMIVQKDLSALEVRWNGVYMLKIDKPRHSNYTVWT